MIDLARITGFDWDDGNTRKNEKHGVAQAQAEEVFFNQPLLMLEALRHREQGSPLPRPRQDPRRSVVARHLHAARWRHPDPGDLGARHAQKGKERL